MAAVTSPTMAKVGLIAADSFFRPSSRKRFKTYGRQASALIGFA